MIERVILIVMDSVGVGELPDAHRYKDEGSNTIMNIWNKKGGLKLPNLIGLGLGNIEGIKGIRPGNQIEGAYGRLAEKSAGKDTTTGHWEIAGLLLEQPFPTYPHGFPDEVLQAFKAEIGTEVLGNTVASGTQIIEELGERHMKTGFPIIYTSADSVFQIAAHEDVIPPEKLYEMCQKARKILKGKHAVGRVIARPFSGMPGSFARTANRRDFSLVPPAGTLLDRAVEKGLEVAAVGKIEDIFAGKGITKSIHTHGNMDGVDRTLDFIKEDFKGIIFTNLVDFDMLFGHRNDVDGYAKALEEFDARIPEIRGAMKEGDVLMITADHGCDPTTPSTDHSREYIPVFIAGDSIVKGRSIGTRSTYSDIAATAAEMLGLEKPAHGDSFMNECVIGKAYME